MIAENENENENAEHEIAEVIDSAYDSLEFPPDGSPDWQRFGASFHPRAIFALRVMPGDEKITVMNLDEYAEHQMRDDLGQHGYSETPGARTISRTGDIAVAIQQFTMNFVHREPAEAVDIFTLARINDAWEIVSVVSDLVHPTSG